ncbi:MAG: hypothetical protein ABJA37_11565 [Ferruginibacter sp.]
MKNKYFYLIWILILTASVSFVIIKYKTADHAAETVTYPLLPRKNGVQKNAEWVFAKENIDKLLAKIKAAPADTKSLVSLANAYISESRISGNTGYYDKAAMFTVNKILSQDANNFEALTLKSLLFLSQHHFAEGLATAEAAQKITPDNSFVYGLMVDGNVEMGNYPAALDAADKMVSLRPDLRSYSRIAYLREIYGDYSGAAEAMKRAVTAGADGQEATEWCRVQLGRLYENMGQTAKARFEYQLSLAARPNYAYALSGLGRLAVFEKKYDSAIAYYRQADSLINDYSIRENLALLYRKVGKKTESGALYDKLIKEMGDNAKIENSDAGIGHYADREMAYAYLHTGDKDKALEHALAEYKRRPKNIDVNETMAWVYYQKEDYTKAAAYIEPAFETKSQNPVLLCTSGLIFAKTGSKEKAKSLLQEGLKNNPVMPEEIRNEAEMVLQQL